MKFFFFLLMIATIVEASAQNIDSLKRELQIAKDDTSKLKVLVKLANAYEWTVPDSTIYYAIQGLPLATHVNQVERQINLYGAIGEAWAGKGNFAVALDMKLKALRLAEKLKDETRLAWAYASIGTVYFYAHDYPNALSYFKRTKAYPKAYKNLESFFSGFLGETYYNLQQNDSASLYLNRSMKLQPNPYWPVPFYYSGKLYAKKKMYDSSLLMFKKGLAIQKTGLGTIEGYNGLSETFLQIKDFDSSISYANKALVLAQQLSFGDNIIQASRLLKSAYKLLEQTDSAFKYQELMIATQDSVYSQEKVRQMEGLAFNDQLRQQEVAAEQHASENRIRMYFIIGIAIVCLTIALLLWRNNRYKQRAFNLLQLQKAETDIQRDKAEKALSELRATQSQLIQAEKMASLGELTAGIAHEIQNPLNFVNNFSEVSSELADEMEDALKNDHKEEALAIAGDIKENLQKINHHGKRADAIVKGMLQHSSTNTGTKELTDINALTDEYLRIAYHGLRAKEKDFNSDFKTNFDEGVGNIEVVPQDIGRVLLNLYNNAFYAVNEKKRQLNGTFEPTVTVTTKRTNDKVEITVKDNGGGIPQKVVDKIFQPFFTTKPTGQGTGLGLSLSYDIVKAHGGDVKVETKEGEGAQFIVQLPT